MRRIGCSWILMTLLIGYSAGCGGAGEAPAYLSQLVPASGKLTIDGQEVEGVDITLTPDGSAGGTSHIAIGRTSAGGVFTLFSPPGGSIGNPEKYPGALPGHYKVTLSRFLMADGTLWDSRKSDEGPMNVGAEETMPVRLTNSHTSPVSLLIPESGNSEILVEVKTGK